MPFVRHACASFFDALGAMRLRIGIQPYDGIGCPCDARQNVKLGFSPVIGGKPRQPCRQAHELTI
ncbi:protein of unknown function [Burkholderia multivorans]